MKNFKYFLMSVVALNAQAFAQGLSPNGYSGIGYIPSATTLSKGAATIAFDPVVPGAPILNGYNTQVGLGLTDNLELVGRLATNDQKCNMFRAADCPPNTYRDFSSSLKWTLPLDWLQKNNAALAIGVTDFGGAATFFRSYYAVGSKKIEDFTFSVGHALAKSPSSVLDGNFASLMWSPNNSVDMSVQKVGVDTSAHVLIKKTVAEDGSNVWLTLNRSLGDSTISNKSWVGWGLTLPLDRITKVKYSKNSSNQIIDSQSKELEKLSPAHLLLSLKERGFYKTKLGVKPNGQLILEVENTAYLWNTLDAAGVVLGVISGAYASESSEQEFELIITMRGMRQLSIVGEAKCVGLWLAKGDACSKMAVRSLAQNTSGSDLFTGVTQLLSDNDESINWSVDSKWQIRPEVILSPYLVSAIGTEYGAFDFDLGANINTVLPLWTGAILESNRIEPMGVGTRQFEQGGAFYGSRLKALTNRRLFHQMINLSSINTQARLSLGTAYSTWNGKQIETSTQSENGRYKFGYTGGSFKNENMMSNNERNYHLLNYRYINNDQQTSVTELTHGKFWAGDKGFSINQRYWYGDTTLNVYFRRTRMGDGMPLVSFAGLQLAIPFTPRENRSLEHLGFRGISQWTYSLETKVLEKNNIITGGYGEVPRIGDSLLMTFNRDRNSTRYYDTNLARMRNAYLNLGSN